MNKRILLTGATGFVGQAVLSELIEKDMKISAAVRQQSSKIPRDVKQCVVGDLSAQTDWNSALEDVDVVIHTAARVHMMNDRANNPLDEFRKVNLLATVHLARKAVAAGVSRFIFISTVKVNGEQTHQHVPFREDDECVPVEPYAVSKYEAEQALLSLARETDMEVVIIRPPLVYGPGVKANFATMIKWVDKGIPLPFCAVRNLRSLLALDNLVDFILCCIDHPNAANEIFLISDGKDVSSPTLLRKVAMALDKKAWLIPVPVNWIKFVLTFAGKKELASRMFGSLQIDSSKARDILNWKPVVTMDDALKKTVAAYKAEK